MAHGIIRRFRFAKLFLLLEFFVNLPILYPLVFVDDVAYDYDDLEQYKEEYTRQEDQEPNESQSCVHNGDNHK